MNNTHSDRLIRNSIISFCNNGLGLLLGFAVSILTARLLGPERYGIYNIVLWFISIVSLILGMGLNFAITKFVSEYQGRSDREAMGQIVRLILWIELVICSITTVLLILQSEKIADYFFNPMYTKLFVIAFAGFIPGMMTAIYSSVLEGVQRFRYFLYYSAAISPISLLTKVVILLTGGGMEELLWANLFYSVINTIFYRWALHREKIPVSIIGSPPAKGLRKKLFRYNFSILTIMLQDKIIWDKSENFFLGKFCAASQAGFFNVAYGWSNKFTSIVGSTFWKVLFPFMSERAGADDHVRLHRVFYLSTRYLAFLSFPIGAAGIVLAWPLLKYVLGPEYAPAQRALQIFFFCSIFGLLAIPQASVLYAVEKQGFIIKYGFILAVTNLLLDYLIIPTYGATGAAAVNGGIQIMAFIGGIIYTVKVADVQLPLKSLFKIMYSAVLMAILMQVVIKVNKELLGFILSIPVGIIVYIGSSMFMGTFEKEDAVVLRKFTNVLPKRIQNLFSFAHNRVNGVTPLSFGGKFSKRK